MTEGAVTERAVTEGAVPERAVTAKAVTAKAPAPGVRRAMLWPHRWIGLVFGVLLSLVFFMGSLSVFAPEIDRWMMPETRPSHLASMAAPGVAAAPAAHSPALDPVVPPLVERLAAGRPPRRWTLTLPDSRTPVMVLRVRTAGGGAERMLTADGRLLPPPGTLGAGSFFYPLHYSLLLTSGFVGYWIVAFISVAMLVGLVSGVILHARIFKDFFTFRGWGQTRRAILDLHNLMGTLVLPFHLMITFTGIVIVLPIVLPAGVAALYGGDLLRFYDEAIGGYERPPSGIAAPLAPIDPMLAEARRLWGGGEPAAVIVTHPGDAAAVVRINRSTDDRISLDNKPLFFDGATGTLLRRPALGPVVAAHRFLSGLHVVAFDRPLLRWLYFLLGLAGWALIVTGLLHWLDRHRPAPGRPAGRGWRTLAALTLCGGTGLVVATLAMMLANRLLPMAVPARPFLEVGLFLAAWLGSALHGALASGGGTLPWRGQSRAVALLAVACVLANWIGTGDQPFRALARGDEAVAGVDLVLLAVAGTAFWAARRLGRRSGQRRLAMGAADAG